jgi:hypothetical protein
MIVFCMIYYFSNGKFGVNLWTLVAHLLLPMETIVFLYYQLLGV